MTIENLLAKLECLSFRVELPETLGKNLSRETGFVLRGALGAALRGAVCVRPFDDCAPCLLKSGCPYPQVFEPPPLPGASYHGAQNPPSPYVTWLEEGDGEWGVRLFGPGVKYAGHLLFAARDAVRKVGNADPLRIALDLPGGRTASIDPENHRDLPPGSVTTLAEKIGTMEPAGDSLEIDLVSPLRLTSEGRLQNRIDAVPFLRAVLRRVGAVASCHLGIDLGPVAKPLAEKANRIRSVGLSLKWIETPRYSARQKHWMNLGGLTGRFRLEGDLDPFLPWLAACEFLHVGKNPAFGLGRIRRVPSSARNNMEPAITGDRHDER